MTIELIARWECRATRTDVHQAITTGRPLNSLTFGGWGIGGLELVVATGRATCRQCGQKITKGEPAIKGPWDAEGNSWTARDVQIHFNECTPEES